MEMLIEDEITALRKKTLVGRTITTESRSAYFASTAPAVNIATATLKIKEVLIVRCNEFSMGWKVSGY